MLAAGVALSLVPAVHSSIAQGRSSSDVTTQRSSQSPYQGAVVEDIVAMVNDQVISKSDYDRAQQDLDAEAKQQGWSQQQLMEQRRDLLRSLIDKQLLLSKGKDLGINGETEVVKRLDEMRKQYHMDTMEDLQKAAEAQGVSFEDLKQNIRDGVITSEVISQEVGSHIQIAPSEIQAYYSAHQQEFERPEQEKLGEILIATPNPDDATQVAEAEKKADGIVARLKSGADFATVAKADSSGPTAQEGGRLGDYKRGDLPKVMEDATFNLPPGQFTAPIRTRQGWLILEVTEHTKGGLALLADVQNEIQEKIGYSKMEPALRSYLARLRDEAAIEVRTPYADSGATVNEIKFIQGAYTPPQPKKKKKVERTRFRQKPVRKQKQTETASAAPPAGVPTLDKVNAQSGAPKTVASSAGTQKPGKKEKIRFGQAPRETLPTGDTKQVDAGSVAPEPTTPATTQVASNTAPGNAVALTNAEGNVISSNDDEKKAKTRFSDRMKEPKQKQAEAKASRKRQKFVPPTEAPEQLAQDQRDQAAQGLNGDTTKKKKPTPAKGGPKRRLSDQDKNEDKSGDKNAPPAQSPASSTQTGTPPAQTTPPGTQSTTPPQQGTTPQF